MSSQALKDYNVDLLTHLPLENDIFFAMADRAGLFPLDTGNNIKAKDTRAKKVSYFLGVIGPGADIYLPKLLKVMKESGVADVVQLAEKITAATGKGSQSKSDSGMSTSSGFNCSEAARELKLRYDDLSNLSYDAMKGRLYAYDVITRDEKARIDRLIGNEQVQKVLDILLVSLGGNQTSKYKGFLQAMEESDDTLLKAKAKELGGSRSVS